MALEPFTWVEIDDEVCTRTFGVGGCPAALGPDVPCKCFGTFATCAAKAAFDPVIRTLKYCEPRAELPRGAGVMFPVLRSVSEISGTVNIAGTDGDMSAFGRNATVTVELDEFPHHDRGVDPYAEERVSGAAQIDEPGYDPATRGGHLGKQRARSPYYTGRALRVVSAYIGAGLTAGQIVNPVTRHYVQSDRAMADNGRSVRIEAKDVLSLAGNDNATVLDVSKGALAADISAVAVAATLTPEGIGDVDYPASGRALIGSEIVSYTRAGDVLTLTGRGLAGTAAAAHSAADTVQQVVHVDRWRVDTTLQFLLHVRAKVPLSFLPLAAWAAEIDRWMPQVRLSTHLCKPGEGVSGLAGELAVLGISVWWDEVAQLVMLQVNRPPDPGAVHELTDAAHLLDISVEDRQKDRLTDVMFFSVQIDPTKSASSAENYRRVTMTVATEAKGAAAYADTKVRKIYCRWLNDGANSVVSTLSKRLLNRFAAAPVRATLTVSVKDRFIGLADVLSVTSRGLTGATGREIPVPFQVIRRSEPDRGSTVEVLAQAFQFSGRYAYAAENTRPDYAASSAAERARGMYAADNATLKMSNGDEPYRAI